MESEECSPVKLFNGSRLQVKSYNCLICGNRSQNETLRKPGAQGVSTFIECLKLKGFCNGYPVDSYDSWFNLEENTATIEGENSVRWHPRCYSNFTNPDALKKYMTDESDESNERETRSQKPLIDLKNCCMFCGYRKHKNDTKLKLLQYESVIDKIEKVCNGTNDNDLRRKIGGDFKNLPAYDAKYHLKCYVKYISQKSTTKTDESNVHDIAFNKLINEVGHEILEGRAIKVKTLLSRFHELLKEEDYENYEAYTTQKLKNKLLKHYGAAISFSGNINTEQYVFSSQISIYEALNTATNYKRLLKDEKLIFVDENEDVILKKAIQILSRDIDSTEGISIKPLNPSDVSLDLARTVIPVKLQTFLRDLCQLEDSDIKPLSIAQDIIFIKSKGRKKMPKHTGLAISLKSSIRSKEFITCLNKLGHSLSYDDALRIETTWASGLLEAEEGYTTIPSNITPGSFIQAAFDNGDYGQDNASQHVTNTVLYQHQNGSFTSAPTARIPCSSTNSRRRSIALLTTELESFKESNDVQIPQSYAKSLIDFNKKISQKLCASTDETVLWILLRNLSSTLAEVDVQNYQTVPGWTGFRKIVSVKVTFPTIIGNCRTVPSPPTEMDVVFNVLKNVRTMLYQLGQKHPCVTVDESIYQMVKKIQWQVPMLNDVTVRLGGFHRAKNFLGILGKRMKSSGFQEIMDESGLFGTNQIEGKYISGISI